MSEPLTIAIPATPTVALSPNGRVHHMARHRAAQAARLAAYYAAREALGPGGMADPARCFQTRPGPIVVEATVAWGKGRKRWDQDNLWAGLKATLDGIAECLGLDDRRFRLGALIQTRDPDGRGCVVVTLTPEEG